MAITQAAFVSMVPKRNVVIDGRGRKWTVVRHLPRPQYGTATFLLDLEDEGNAMRYSFVPGTGIVDEEYGIDVDLNHDAAHVI